MNKIKENIEMDEKEGVLMNNENTIEKPSYFAIIPANDRYDKELKAKAKLLYGEIS